VEQLRKNEMNDFKGETIPESCTQPGEDTPKTFHDKVNDPTNGLVPDAVNRESNQKFFHNRVNKHTRFSTKRCVKKERRYPSTLSFTRGGMNR